MTIKLGGTSTALGTRTVTCTSPTFGGFLDGANCSQIAGWAWDSAQPNSPINVDIYDGTTLLGTAVADVFRQDLLNAGLGNGKHGFTYSTPALYTGAAHSISLHYGGTSTVVAASPKSITCPKETILTRFFPGGMQSTGGAVLAAGAVVVAVVAYEIWLHSPAGQDAIKQLPPFPSIPLPDFSPPPPSPLPGVGLPSYPSDGPDADADLPPFPFAGPIPLPPAIPMDRYRRPKTCPPPTAIPGRRPAATPPPKIRKPDPGAEPPDIEKPSPERERWNNIIKGILDVFTWFT